MLYTNEKKMLAVKAKNRSSDQAYSESLRIVHSVWNSTHANWWYKKTTQML